jgi:hypothetical protein
LPLFTLQESFSGTGSAYAEVTPGSFSWSLGGTSNGSVHGVTLGSVDGDPGVQIEMHIFVGSKAPWDHIGGSARQFAEFPPRT